MELTIKEKQTLIAVARESIERLFTQKETTPINFEIHPVLQTNAGAFVTLTIGGRLRGCIGYIVSDQPLYDTVRDAAVQAATGDPRFHPLTEKELAKIEIEISVLSPPFPMESYDDIVIGKHGLILEERGRHALLLPQVPVEHNMNRDQFLAALCEKGGFSRNMWKEKQVKLSAFTALVFSEEELEKGNDTD
ncbi:MAG: AmmeMemoRadiSam system protein A [bacterium]